LRYILLILSLAIWLAIGRFGLGFDSVIDLIHFASVPLLASYLVIFRPANIIKNISPYCTFFVFITLLVTAYLIAFSRTISYVRVNWFELPVAVYFLLSTYIILFLLDKFIDSALSSMLRINTKKTIIKSSIKTLLRISILFFAVIPYLVAVFTTHWIKFEDGASPKQLLDLNYRQVSFNAKDGAKLEGWFIPSTTRLSDSSVIIVPGRNLSKNLFLPYAKVLSSSGYNVFLIDLRGNGGSSGHKYSFGIEEANDVIGAVDYLTNYCSESSKYVFGFGISEGASALVAAASRDDRFTGIVIDSTCGYEFSYPVWLSDFLPGWMEKALLKVTKSVFLADIGQPMWNTKDFYEKISQISPCPVLVTNSLRNGKADRAQTVELYTQAKDPKMLWLNPPDKNGEINIGNEGDYFKNILDLFDLGRTKQQTDRWRTIPKNPT
jgi:pimeloyl-ACP methyl ester carboxylesterase